MVYATVRRVLLQVDLHVVTEIRSEGNAVKVLTGLAVSQWSNIEDQSEDDEQAYGRAQRNHNADDLAAAVKLAKADVRHQGECQQEAENEAEEVGPVVEPGQEAEQEEHKDGYDQLEDSHKGASVHLVTLEHLHQQAGQDTKLGSRGPRLNNTQVTAAGIGTTSTG